jgi:hypothetical protein
VSDANVKEAAAAAIKRLAGRKLDLFKLSWQGLRLNDTWRWEEIK